MMNEFTKIVRKDWNYIKNNFVDVILFLAIFCGLIFINILPNILFLVIFPHMPYSTILWIITEILTLYLTSVFWRILTSDEDDE